MKRSTSAPLPKLFLQYSPPSDESQFTNYLVQRATAVQLQATDPVCSRVLPVCQRRFVRNPLGARQTVPAAAVKVTHVLPIRIQPENMNHSA